MKKHWKKIALILGVLVLAVAGSVFYTFQVKEYDVADEKVDEVTKEKIEIDLPDDTKLTVDEDGNVTEEKDEKDENDTESSDEEGSSTEGTTGSSATGSSAAVATTKTSSDTKAVSSSTGSNVSKASANNGSSAGSNGNNGSDGKGSNGNSGSNGNTGSNSNGSNGNNGSDKGSNGNNGSNGNGSNGNNGSDKPKDRVSVADIKEKYATALEGLEGTANARLDSLIAVGIKDYNANKSKGYPFFYNKYTAAAADLEAQMDKAFYGVVDVMKRDLKANGLAESHVKSVVNEYENTKKQRKQEIMKKAVGLK
ncbi:hypothetical protein B0H99_104151 [Planomicrobium soli]|uniref:Uncharacterized protein n=1 Tax=Planomicrobium soli TaxID=1176648 RepID=A0A2P8H399_9BACL|nr:hypothetical protein [Planomicrobium soli]PSL40689.1 hypothetical protein B0H99_104151 [Planomicrobium soli]